MSIIIERPYEKQEVRCVVRECTSEVVKSAYIETPSRKELVFFCSLHYEQYINYLAKPSGNNNRM